MDQVVRLWLKRGVTKHKAATIAECEMLAAAGAKDVLFAYNPVGPNVGRIVALAKKFPACGFTVTADHEIPLRQLSETSANAGVTIGVMLDVNVGMERTGITPESAGAVPLYALTATLQGLRPAGFHVYDGHQRQLAIDERREAVAQQWPRVVDLRTRCEAAGAKVPALACGGTPTFPCYAAMSDSTIELCPGTCVFHDAGYGTHFPDLPFSPAAAIVTRVISRPAADRVTLDIGNKAVAADPPKGSRIFLPDLPDAVQEIHSEEHMGLVTPDAGRFQPGDVLMAIPMHVCPTSALYDRVAVIENGRISCYWDVTSRNRKLTI
jgi:D-serine deaminase-like pyridoxal phosphate-dependent protein